jgi:hypothetical protein
VFNTGAQYLPTGGEGPVQQWWGIYQAYIAVNNDPLAQGRVKLRVPQVFGQMTSGWASPMVPLSYVPKVSTIVTCMFIGGDPTMPVWFGNFAIPEGAAGMVISATEPASPEIGEIWVSSSTGLMSEWNGAGWVAYQIGGAAIQTGVGLDAPNITGGTITGSQFIADGGSGEFLGYTGTPALGNLAVSVSPVAGTDAETNAYLAGVVVYADNGYGGYIQVDDNASVGASAVNMIVGVTSEYAHAAVYSWSPNPGNAAEYELLAILGPASTYDHAQPSITLRGSAKNGSAVSDARVSNGDGNSYALGQTFALSNGATVSSTSPVSLGLQVDVAARSYYVRGCVIGTAASSGSLVPGTIHLHTTGGAVASAVALTCKTTEMEQGATTNVGQITATDSNPTVMAGAWTLGATYAIEYEGIVQLSHGGAMDIYGLITSSGASWTCSGDSYLILSPL